MCFFFFFQAEDGIRDKLVTGVQTCALPILLVADGQWAAAEGVLREVIERAEADERPLLQAEAMRDLSMVLRGTGRHADAQTAARTARAIFTRLGAEGELRNLARQRWDDAFATELRGSLAPLHVAQELADAGRYGELL